VDVRSGAWSIPATEASGSVEAMSVQGLELGRRPAVGEHAPEARLPLPVDGRMDLSARWPPRLTLHVRGSDGPLEPVLMIEPSDRTATELPHPGWQPGGRRASPLILDAPSSGTRVVYVGADGHAWTRVEVLAEEAERVLVLEPGGDLRVRVESAERDPGTAPARRPGRARPAQAVGQSRPPAWRRSPAATSSSCPRSPATNRFPKHACTSSPTRSASTSFDCGAAPEDAPRAL
jgi:hypothetical protein